VRPGRRAGGRSRKDDVMDWMDWMDEKGDERGA